VKAEREVLTTILQLTRSGPVDCDLICKTARVPHASALATIRNLSEQRLVGLHGQHVDASLHQRVEIAVRAVKMGADFESVCRALDWREFEGIARGAFEAFGYRVVRNLRFKGANGRRGEIDLLACKKPVIASIDCKCWKHNWTRASITKVVDEQVQRTQTFTHMLPRHYQKIGLDGWNQVTVIPIVLALLAGPFKFHQGTPIVPIMQLQSFIKEMPAHIEELTHFNENLTSADKKLTEY
jgi:Holliday junction resolvase-like predicted endonuclease